MDVRAGLAQPLGFLEIGAIYLRIVLQLPRLLDTVVKRLSVRRPAIPSVEFEQTTTFFGERNDAGSRSSRTVWTRPKLRRCHSSP